MIIITIKEKNEIFDNDGNYIYKNIELTTNVFKGIFIYLFDGKQFKRQKAIDEVVAFHIEHNGILQLDSYIGTFKKVTSSPDIKSFISNVSYGTWRLNINNQYNVDELQIVKDNSNKISFEIDETIGEGNSTVYVYYYDVYKDRALLQGKNIWECKVGRTDKKGLERIISQTGTCYPERPHIALFIKCYSSYDMESALHSI